MTESKEMAAPSARTCTQGKAHEWVVFSTALSDGWLMLQCVKCGLHGTIKDPSKKEWNKAFHAPARPYRWKDRTRVHISDTVASRQLYVMRSVTGKKCPCYSRLGVSEPRDYERVPAEITRHDGALSAEDREQFVELASFVKTSDLCSRLFPCFIENFQKDTGNKFPASILSITRRIEQIDAKGLHCSAPVVARVLWEYAGGAKYKPELAENN
jgi:hypothetical protein